MTMYFTYILKEKDVHTNNTYHNMYTSSEDKIAEKSNKDNRYAILKFQKRIHTTVMNKEDTNDDEETNMIRNEVLTKINTDIQDLKENIDIKAKDPNKNIEIIGNIVSDKVCE